MSSSDTTSETMSRSSDFMFEECKDVLNETGSNSVIDSSSAEMNSTRINIQKSCYTWKIENFGIKINSSNYYSSPVFQTEQNLQFCIALQANDRAHSLNWVSLYLKHEPLVHREILVKVKISLLNYCGEEFHSQGHAAVYKSGQTSWGYRKFFSTKELQQNGDVLLPEDTLTVRCEIGVCIDETSKSIFSSNKAGNVTKLVKDISSLLESAEFSDMTMVVGEEKFPVHKNILAARSPVFARMFKHEMTENLEKRVHVNDFDVETVKSLLEFIYTGKIELSNSTLMEKLLAISEKYEIDDLKIVCEEQLMWNLCIVNAVETLLLANKFNALNLEKFCLSFICKNAADVFSTSEWKEYKIQIPEVTNKLLETFAKMDLHSNPNS